MAAPPDDVERLRNHLLGAVQRALRLCNDFTIHFPADLPAAVLAALAREQSDVPFSLVHVVRGNHVAQARRLAKHLGLALVERRCVPRDVEHAEQFLERLGLERSEDVTRFALAAFEARLSGPRMLTGHGAAAAIEAPLQPSPRAAADRRAEARIAETLGLQIRYPYLDRGVLPFLERIRERRPLGDVLQDLADRLGLQVPGP